ncbi:hypothetical protein [Dyadobacter crusticola]|uniref:hypothetical protein n=1 Tax=Dyadobacter crusticola TaxID=292407 RepID=UPI0004E28844|nr:hypothetical protein [Dyadobacter crusticola]
MKLPSVLLFFLLAFSANAQSGKDLYYVRSGRDANKVVPYEGRFQYPEFQDGQVLFRNGKISKAKLNYNRVHGEVVFISPEQDTMLFADGAYIKRVLIADDVYYYQKGHGHVRVERDFGNAKLGRKEFLGKIGHEKRASYGQYSSTSAISSYTTFVNSRGEYQFLDVNDRVLLAKREIFFFIDRNNTFYVANRNNILKVFPLKKGEINKYLRENDVNFEVKAEVEKLLEFCSEL